MIGILVSETKDINPMTVTNLLYDNLLASQLNQSSDLQVTGFAGKLSKSSDTNENDAKTNTNTAKYFPIKLTNDHNSLENISCGANKITIHKKSTDDFMCVKKSTAESMTHRGWDIYH